MNKIFLIILFVFITDNLFSQSVRSVGMGGAFSAVSDDIFSNNINPSGSAKMKNRSVYFGISPSPFGLKELETIFVGYAEPFYFGNLQLTVSSYGFDLFKKYTSSICFAKNIFNDFSFGLNIHYDYFNIKNYGSDGFIGIDLGALVKVIPQLNWGFSLSNINSPTIGQDKDKEEQLLRMGISYTPIKEFVMDLDIVKDLKYPANICFGFDYQILEPFSIRAGINTEPPLYSFGFGVVYLNFGLDYAITVHNELGSSHLFSLSYTFDK